MDEVLRRLPMRQVHSSCAEVSARTNDPVPRTGRHGRARYEKQEQHGQSLQCLSSCARHLQPGVEACPQAIFLSGGTARLTSISTTSPVAMLAERLMPGHIGN